jgi:hypothetical protein
MWKWWDTNSASGGPHFPKVVYLLSFVFQQRDIFKTMLVTMKIGGNNKEQSCFDNDIVMSPSFLYNKH